MNIPTNVYRIDENPDEIPDIIELAEDFDDLSLMLGLLTDYESHDTDGFYYWKHGKFFVKAAKQMIQKDIRVNNEFYTCPVYNENILDGKKIKIFDVKKMWGLGTPKDLEYFLQNYQGSI